ncbi:MAG: YfdX family protein [Candidatus Nitrosocosmicus sp.]|nr:YfdX family protein [Candidatus Nitrosocosmicus sp.]
MKSKNMVSISILLILGTTFVGLLTLPSYQMVSASIVGGSNASDSNQGGAEGCNPQWGDCQEAINHINKAQSALQSGDTEGAQTHLDLAKQALCSFSGC